MKNKKPELYRNEKGIPKGYRVGISDGIYGICPFCGKSYTEEDIKNRVVNFEHVYSRFAAKQAIDEEDPFLKIESEFMVAVHKVCNDMGAKELEKPVSKILNNFGKPDVQITKKDARILMNYCIKVSIFLRYLFLWDDINGQSVYNDEKLDIIDITPKYEFKYYRDFCIRIRNVESSGGLWWGVNEPGNQAECCFTAVFGNIEISFFPSWWRNIYQRDSQPTTQEAIFIKRFGDEIILLHGNENIDLPFCLDHINRKGVPWKLEKLPNQSYRWYNHHIKTLASAYDDMFWMSKNYFTLQKKLSILSQDKFEKIGVLSDLYKGIVFSRNEQLYFVDNDGIVQNMQDLPDDTEIPAFCFKQFDLSHLPNISKLKINGDIRIVGGNLESLVGCPQFVQGHVYVRSNKLKSLQGAPKYVGKSFHCDSNELVSLDGAPNIVNGDFTCRNNKLQNLIGGPTEVTGDYICTGGNKIKSLQGAPEEIGGFFSFDAENLKSLDGLPKARSYFPSESRKYFDSVDELQAWFKEYKKEQKKGNIKGIRDGTKVVGAMSAVQDIENSIKPDDPHVM